jgi:gliding motility-associated-like protein
LPIDDQFHLTDNNSCLDSLTLVLTQPAAPLQVTALTSNISCFGGNNGSIDVTISGGTVPYAFWWSNAVVVQDQQNLYAGIYQINITDNKGCTTTGIYNLTQPAMPVSTQMMMTEPLCFGDSNGTATVITSGGTPGYTYLWQNGQITPTISGLPIGSYIVEVTDANNCKIKDTVIVTQPPLLSVNADSSWVSCWGLADGGVQSSVVGGVGPYSYNWSPINIASPNVGNLPAGIYTVTVTDIFNCQAQSSTEILQPDSLYATFVTTNILCNGFSTGAINASVFGGTPSYSFFCPTLLPSEDLDNLSAGTYLYSVVDDNGCSKQYSLVLSQPSAVSTTAQMTPVNCFGGSDGQLDITTTGGAAPYSYLWSNGQTTEDVDSLSVGNYSVQITDANSCVSTFNFAVTQPLQPLSLSLSQVNVACFGDSTGLINLSVSGGTPNYSYAWNNGAVSQDIFSLDTGLYQVLVADANGCIDSISTIITQPDAPISISETHLNILCFGASTGSIDIAVLGGTPSILNGYSYDWSNNQTTEDIQTLPSGTYEVVVTDSLLCTDTLEIILTQPIAPLDVTFDIENVKCFGDSTGSILANILGGTAPYQFGWSTLDSTLFIDSLPWGNYSISIIDSNNCLYAETALVSQPLNPLSATYSPIQPTCFGYSDGQLILSTTGGTPGYQYDWTTGDSTSVVDSLATGNYSVLVTDTNGCTFNLDCFLDQPAQIQPSFDSDILSGCSPLEVEFFNTSDADFNCEWTFGDSLSFSGCDDVIITFDTGGVYDVQLTAFDANGCFNSVSVNDYITVFQTPVASFTASPSLLFPESPTTNILNTSSDCEFYIWNMGVGDPDEMYFEPGEYQYPANIADTFLITLYAISSEGCADTAYQEIYFNNNPFFYVPNTFIPDGDNKNEIWTPVFSNLSNVKKYNVQIFNRWGELVFESNDPTFGWNGTYNGNTCQDGTYIWKLQFTWYDKKVHYANGHVNLLR